MAKKSTEKSSSKASSDLVVHLRDGTCYLVECKAPSNKPLPIELDFAAILRQKIVESGLSQYKMSELTNVPKTVIRQFVSGQEIRISAFNRLALLMGFELRYDPERAPRKV